MTVMTNRVYQTTVEELEALLSPRVVSRSLKEGLRQVGRTPETAGMEDIEKILKGQVYRQLQLTMPVTRAKDTVSELIDKLRAAAANEGAAPAAAVSGGLEAQGQQLAELQEALKPFNLYFEWPEVQKLRAQVQLLEADHEAGREAPALLAGAREQLQLVMQKREDQLVLQARDLGELEEALEAVRELGGPKVRRLETLVNQVRAAQQNRQLASAESDRAQRLARDLRVALEAEGAKATTTPETAQPASAVATPPAPVHDQPLDVDSEEAELLTVDPPQLDEETTERIRKLDIDAEAHDLRQLEHDFAQVLAYVPALSARVAELREELQAGRSVAPVLAGFGADLESTQLMLRDDLREELEELLASLPQLRPEVDTTELAQAARVTLGILSTSLPDLADVEHVRRLAQVAREQDADLAKAEEQHARQLQEQDQLIGRLEATLLRSDGEDDGVSAEVERLRAEFDNLRLAQAQQTVVPEVMAAVRQAEERLARSLAERATERSERRRARLTALRAQLESLPVTQTLHDRAEATRLEIERLLAEQENTDAVAALLIDDEGAPLVPSAEPDDRDVDALAEVVAGIRAQLTGSLRNRLMNMAERAAELGNNNLIERLQRALMALERDEYPDINQLQASLRQEHEAQRLEQVDELHRLATAAAPFAGEESPRAVELRRVLDEARAQLERGALAVHLPRAVELLEGLRAEADERLASVPRRLDAALARLEKVAALNSEDVGTARRILNHLDSQRDALPRLSPGLRLQLEASLSSAESLLDKLEGEFEATRLVADEVMSGGLLDGVLGLFRTGSEERPEPAPGAVAIAPQARLEAFLAEESVTGAALLDAGGELVAGRLERAPEGLPQLRAAAAAVAGPARVVSVESAAGALLLGWLANGDCLVVELADASSHAILLSRLRRALQEIDAATP